MQISSEEHGLLRDSLRRLLQQYWAPDKAIELQQQPSAMAGVWRQLAALGLSTLGTAPDEGGLREILLAQEELGRAACPGPLTGAAVANLLLWPARERAPALETLFWQLHSGAAILALALPAGELGEGGCVFSNGQLHGRVAFVEHAELATHLLLEIEGGIALAPRSDRMKITPTPGYSIPSLSEIVLDNVLATRVTLAPQALADLSRLARMQLTARALGAAQRGYEMVVGGGTAEIQRNIIALKGVGLPR